ncbi:hypothetical protein COF80_30960 [Bacillus toyonensis]|nr:hypothetical protein CN586_30860 [Bacillus toyonensis]PEM40203.1 hypothetical protein CN636_24150 [Bacillus toyonensis]PGB57038.1 hypothetical protein COM00_26740 [Bacillus toyonensis]PHE81768.1 hypothetical protein COF80_30960 [Bacillus toyonensis]
MLFFYFLEIQQLYGYMDVCHYYSHQQIQPIKISRIIIVMKKFFQQMVIQFKTKNVHLQRKCTFFCLRF